jgi:3-demethoxyubiquinol 3-hydroxylase
MEGPPSRKAAVSYNESVADPSPLDVILTAADRALRSVFAPAAPAREVPGPAPDRELSESDRRHAAGLMRVNHAGEIAAQALYHGQSLLARDTDTRQMLLAAAREEADHLAWCEQRLAELGSRPSLLNPLWYAGSFAIGTLAAAFGDRASLGFVAETERQVEGHLHEHLGRLPPEDERSRAILAAMQADEVAHGARARANGAAALPWPVGELMRGTARVMTRTAYWV